jgi:hypothetical protein
VLRRYHYSIHTERSSVPRPVHACSAQVAWFPYLAIPVLAQAVGGQRASFAEAEPNPKVRAKLFACAIADEENSQFLMRVLKTMPGRSS